MILIVGVKGPLATKPYYWSCHSRLDFFQFGLKNMTIIYLFPSVRNSELEYLWSSDPRTEVHHSCVFIIPLYCVSFFSLLYTHSFCIFHYFYPLDIIQPDFDLHFYTLPSTPSLIILFVQVSLILSIWLNHFWNLVLNLYAMSVFLHVLRRSYYFIHTLFILDSKAVLFKHFISSVQHIIPPCNSHTPQSRSTHHASITFPLSFTSFTKSALCLSCY